MLQRDDIINRESVLRMACEVGFETMLKKGRILGFDRDGDYTEELEHFAQLVAAAEREVCAKVCETLKFTKEGPSSEAKFQRDLCAKAIRARGETTLRGQQ